MASSVALRTGVKRAAAMLVFGIIGVVAGPRLVIAWRRHGRGLGTKILSCAPPADLQL